eukprot:TRINITY_DN19466_c0_g1_i1.p2 TRINITY_DN19466_c0_g1~~TRINITY_DN19466_c0_g1_i1.p2  ORF type:complete len:129 (-),score=0.13 TRINITY_DN19466_c0_g1_i1:18-404(-)
MQSCRTLAALSADSSEGGGGTRMVTANVVIKPITIPAQLLRWGNWEAGGRQDDPCSHRWHRGCAHHNAMKAQTQADDIAAGVMKGRRNTGMWLDHMWWAEIEHYQHMSLDTSRGNGGVVVKRTHLDLC